MTTTEIRAIAESVPFRVFRLFLGDGRSFEITHPEYLTIFKKAPRIAIERDDGSYQLVNLPLVTSVEVTSKEGTSAMP